MEAESFHSNITSKSSGETSGKVTTSIGHYYVQHYDISKMYKVMSFHDIHSQRGISNDEEKKYDIKVKTAWTFYISYV